MLKSVEFWRFYFFASAPINKSLAWKNPIIKIWSSDSLQGYYRFFCFIVGAYPFFNEGSFDIASINSPLVQKVFFDIEYILNLRVLSLSLLSSYLGITSSARKLKGLKLPRSRPNCLHIFTCWFNPGLLCRYIS